MDNAIIFPQVNVQFGRKIGSPLIWVVAGGRQPSAEWLTAVLQDKVWCADKGINACRDAKFVPERVIGDFDSADHDALAWAKNHGAILAGYSWDKDLTDLQIVLKTIGESGAAGSCFITGVFGGRFDHCIANMYSVLWAKEWNVDVCGFADEYEMLFFLEGPDQLVLDFKKQPSAISLLSLSSVAEGVSIENVYWPLRDVTLFAGQPYAISNRLGNQSTGASVKVASGVLGVYISWNM